MTFNSTTPSENITYAPANSITINSTGIYEISYFLNSTASVGVLTEFAVRNSTVAIPETVVTTTLSLGAGFIYSGSTIVNLTVGDVLDMVVSSLVGITLTLADGMNANLIVTKLD